MASILVVDDDEAFRQSACDLLEIFGHEIITVGTGLEAIEEVKRHPPDVILMDIMMPGMNGLQAFASIRELAPEVKVLIVSGYWRDELMKEAMGGGVFGCFEKPVDLDRLAEIIDHLVQHKPFLLVMDDDPDLCASFRDVLEDRGLVVTTATDPKTGLKALQEYAFDVVLLDVVLGSADALQVYQDIRDIRQDATVIAITGYPKKVGPVIRQMVDSNVYTCLTKPLDIDKLFKLIEAIRQQKMEGRLTKPEMDW